MEEEVVGVGEGGGQGAEGQEVAPANRTAAGRFVSEAVRGLGLECC